MQKDAAGSGRRVLFSDPGNGSHAGPYPHACGLSAAVLYFRYDQDHERESCTSDVPFTSGAETVSYTHLDVYKRQDPFMAPFPELLDVGIMGHCIHGKRGLCMAAGVECYQNGMYSNLQNMQQRN